MTHTAIYQANQLSPISNTVVSELNAAVLTRTFPGKGIHKADLYSCRNSADVLVLKGSCAPIHGTFVKSVTIELK